MSDLTPVVEGRPEGRAEGAPDDSQAAGAGGAAVVGGGLQGTEGTPEGRAEGGPETPAQAGAGGLVSPQLQHGFLTDAQLASLQGTVIQSLPWLGTVLSNMETRDAANDEAENWQPIAIYNCDIEFVSDQEEVVVGGQIQASGYYLITLPWNAVIKASNRIQINATVYEVKNRFTNYTDQAAVFVTAEEVGE